MEDNTSVRPPAALGPALRAAAAAAAAALLAGAALAAPTVYPTGTTIYDSERAFNGWTVFIAPNEAGGVLIDMNGETVRTWPEFSGIPGGPVRLLPGGHVVGGVGARLPHQEAFSVRQLDWDGNVVWEFDRLERVETDDGERWASRQHHDWQRASLPAGYYSPEAAPAVTGERTLLLTHRNVTSSAVTDRVLEDDYLVEVSWDGEIGWTWLASDHVEELGFSDEARAVLRRAPGYNEARGSFDWLHVNSATYVGPNKWHDAGDERFAPDNVIISSRAANIVAIVDRDGSVVWRIGPDYRAAEGERGIGQIIGQHHPHLIPKGLPGAGNMLIFDNGGAAGYGHANPAAPDGVNSLRRGSSRVVEIDPVTLETVWEYSMTGTESFRFFSHYVSSAQRLPNGNTLITEGADGRLFEITADGEIVWEYVSPYFSERPQRTNRVYRAYRVPYDWVEQLPRPEERDVVPPDVAEFRLPAE